MGYAIRMGHIGGYMFHFAQNNPKINGSLRRIFKEMLYR